MQDVMGEEEGRKCNTNFNLMFVDPFGAGSPDGEMFEGVQCPTILGAAMQGCMSSNS